MTRKTKTTTPATETNGRPEFVTPEQWARIVHLAESATVKQTPDAVLATVIRQGLKAIERRRKGTEDARIAKAEDILRAAGKLPAKDEADEEDQAA